MKINAFTSLATCTAALALAACSPATDEAAAPTDDAAATGDAATPDAGADATTAAADAAGAVACSTGETPVFVCSGGGKSMAICAAGGSLRMTYRQPGRADVQVSSTGKDGKAFMGGVVGGGGGQQANLRFVSDGTDYIAYRASPGQYMDVTEPWSGVTVMKGDTVFSEIKCTTTGKEQELGSNPGGVEVEADKKDLGWL